MNASDVQKYSKKSLQALIKLATEHFNAYIRKRDQGNRCISCGSIKANQAGHYYSAGHYPELRFNEDNCHLQCTQCNMYLSGNLIEYRKGLTRKIGTERIEKLDLIVALTKNFKWDRLSLIQTILTYKNK